MENKPAIIGHLPYMEEITPAMRAAALGMGIDIDFELARLQLQELGRKSEQSARELRRFDSTIGKIQEPQKMEFQIIPQIRISKHRQARQQRFRARHKS